MNFPEDDERETDILDEAGRLTRTLTKAFVSNVQDAAMPEQKQNADGTWPVTECECGEPIPEGRLKLGKIRCIECQTDFENEKKARLRS